MNEAASTLVTSSAGSGGEYRHLELLARVKKALDTAREVVVPASDIGRFKDQPRQHFNDDSIWRLSESIDAGGQTTSGMIRFKPANTQYEMLVEKGDLRYKPGDRQFRKALKKGGRFVLQDYRGHANYELIDGERRWRANLLIPESRRPTYKAKLIEADDDVVQYLISGIANFNREGHTAVEVMETIDRLVGFELPMKEIASLLGISEHWAYQMHGLKKLEPEVRKLLDPRLPKAEQLPVVAAVQISKIESRFQRGLAERVLRKDITLGRLRGEVVKLAQREGSHIRLREVDPRKQWESFRNRIDLILRSAGDVEDAIQKKEVSMFVRARPTEVRDLLKNIKEAREALSRVEDLILAARTSK